MDNYKHLCPVCKADGKIMFLQLKQINMTTATYLCKDLKCTYPLGHPWMLVERDILNEPLSDTDSSDSDEVNEDIKDALSPNSSNVDDYLCNNTSEDGNVIIDDPDKLFTTSASNATSLQPIVLATGVPDSDVVDVAELKDANSDSVTNNQEVSELKHDEKEEVKTNNVSKVKQFCFVNVKTGKISSVNQIEGVNVINKNSIDTVSKTNVPVMLRKVNITSNILLNNSKNYKVFKNLSSLENKPADKIEFQSETDKEKNIKPGRRKQSLGIILPHVEDISADLEHHIQNTNFEPAIKTKLKLRSKKPKQPDFSFSESVLEEALETVKVDELISEPQKNSVDPVLNEKKSAACFNGFQYTKIIKADQLSPKKIPAKKSVYNSLDINLIEPDTESVDDSKTDGENKNDVVSVDTADADLNELLDNIDSLGSLNVPNNSVDTSEVDEWLSSLCQ